VPYAQADDRGDDGDDDEKQQRQHVLFLSVNIREEERARDDKSAEADDRNDVDGPSGSEEDVDRGQQGTREGNHLDRLADAVILHQIG